MSPQRFLAGVLCSLFLLIAGPAFALPDWFISIEDPGQDGLPAGSTLVYEVQIRNDAANPADVAPETTITFDISPGTTFVSGGGLLNCVPLGVEGASVTCDVPSIPASSSLDFLPEVLTTVQGTVTLTGTLPTAGDSDPGSNTISQDTTVNAGADIELDLTGPVTATSGSVADYTFTATNRGPNDSNGFEIVFPVPVGLTNIVVPSNCVLNTAMTDYVCSIPGVVPVDGSITIDFSGQVSSGDGSTIGVSGAVGNGSPADGVSDNNLASLATEVSAGSDLSITKGVSGDTFLVGETATFTISAGYVGDDPTGLTITDIVPSNYEVQYPIDTSGTPFDCSASSGNSISCSLASGGSAGTVSLGDIVFDALVVLESGGTDVTNSAEIDAAGPPDPDPSNNISDDGGVDLQDPFVDHQINKTGPTPLIVAVGSTYTYPLSSTNLGNADFIGTIQIVDSVPAGMTITAATGSGWTCLPAGDVVGPADLTCTIEYDAANPLEPNETTPRINTSVLVTAEGALANTAQVSAPIANIEDVLNGNDIITVNSTGLPAGDSPDVEITKSASETTLQSGEIQTFVLEILNNGTLANDPVDAEGVEITDRVLNLINNTVAPGGGIDSFVIDQAGTDLSCNTSNSGSNGVLFSCDISVLPVCSPGSCPTITINARPGGNERTNLRNTATVDTIITADSDPGNDRATVSYDLTAQTDVTVAKTASPSPATVGQDVLYIITAQNTPMVNGIPVVLSTAEDVTVTDTVPDDMTFVSLSASGGGVCTTTLVAGDTTAGDTISCTWDSIANNNQQIVELVLRPNNETLSNPPIAPSTAPGIENAVEIETSTDETDETNNTASAPVDLLEPAFDLIVNKVDDIDPVGVGQSMTYTVTVLNSGPSAAENVTIVDSMPGSRLALSSVVDPVDGSCSITNPGTPGANPPLGNVGAEITCVVPYLAAGESTSFEIIATGDRKGSVTNSVTVSADGSADYETNLANDTANQQTNVRTSVDLTVNSKIPSGPVYNLGEEFFWTIQVENRAGDPSDYFGEADGVVVSDNLPTGMELAGPPVAAPSETSFVDCTGDDGDTSFSCDVGDLGGEIGTMASGEVVDIVVPVRVVSISTDGQSFENSASIEATSSYEPDTTNNEASGDVIINAGSISGEIFRDFNDDGIQDPDDTLVEGVTLTLSGTDLNGNTVTRTITTTDGTYSFDLLPEGDYVITRQPISEPYQDDGQHIPGTGATPLDGPTGVVQSPTIMLGGNEDAPDYDFAIVPQARIGLAKAVVGAPALNADGSFDVTFVFEIENFSLEELNSIEVLDPLEGAANLFGTYVASDVTSARGQYTILTPPTSACGGANATFTGHSTTTALITGATIAAGDTCEVSVTLQINPTDPFPTGTPQYENSATVDGVGTLSGQTSATNPLLNDISDDGTNADSNNDGSGAGESDPTPVNVNFTTTVLLEKEVDTSAFADPNSPQPGELLTYLYTVTNPTDFTVFDITVTENAPGPQGAGSPPNFSGTGTPPVVGAPTGGGDIDGDGDDIDLAPMESLTYSATYAITQADIDAGFVLNTATLVATDVYGDPLSDFSDDPVTGGEDYNGDGIDDDPTVALLPANPVLELVKSAVAGPIQADGTFDVTYTLETTNTGNVTLDNLTLIDDLNAQFGAGVVRAVVSQPQVTVQPTLAGSVNVADTATAYAGDDTPLIGTTGALAVGDSYTVEFTVTLGTVTGVPATFENTATTGGTQPATTANPTPTQVTDNSENGATTTDDGDPVTPEITDGTDPNGGDDDTEIPTVISINLSGEVTLVKSAVLNDDDGSGDANVGDTITYTYELTNTDLILNALNVSVVENEANFSGDFANLTALVVDVASSTATDLDASGTANDLAPGASIVYTATYTLDQDDVDAGTVENQADATATDPYGNALIDTSDNGAANGVANEGTDGVDNGTGDATGDDNPTLLPLGQEPELTILKTAGATSGLNADGTFTQEFSITVTNTGNTTITDPTLLDDVEIPFATAFEPSDATDATGGVTIAPAVVFTPAVGSAGVGPVENAAFDGDGASDAALIDGVGATLFPNDAFTVTFTVLLDATELTDAAGDPVDTVNTAAVDGTPAGGTLTYVGTDENDDLTTDGTAADAITPPVDEGEVTLVKAAVLNDDDGSGDVSLGDTITYTYEVTNTDPVLNALNVSVVEDEANFSGDFANLTALVLDAASSTATDIDGGGTLDDLVPGASIVYTATYTLDQTDLDAGRVENQADATGTDPFGNPLTDASDNGTANDVANEGVNGVDDVGTGDGSGDDNPTVLSLVQMPEIQVVKGAPVVGALQADGSFDVTYTLVTMNVGSVTLNNLTLVDDLNSQFGAGALLSVVSQPTVTVQPTLPESIAVTDTTVPYTGDATPLIGTTGSLAVGDSFTVEFTVSLDATAASAFENTATVGGTPPVTEDNPTPMPVSDDSQNDPTFNTTDDGDPSTGEVSDGTDPDGGDGDTEIPTIVTPPVDAGGLSLVKTAVLDADAVGGPEVNAGDTITYTYVVTNDSTVLNALNVTVSEPNDATNAFTGTGAVPAPTISAIAPNGTDLDAGGALNDLAPGASMSFTATYELTQADVDAGLVENSAVADAVDPFGNDLTDTSDNGADGDGTDGVDNGTGDATGDDNPTLLPLGQEPELTILKTAGATSGLNADGTFTQEFSITVTNTGNTTITDPTLLDDVEIPFATAFEPSDATDATGGVTIAPAVVFTPAVGSAGVGPVENAAFDGDGASDAALIDGVGATLFPNDAFTVTFTVLLDATELTDAAGDPVDTVNTAAVDGTPAGGTLTYVGTDENDDLTTDGTAADAITPPVDEGEVTLVKAAVLNSSVVGGPEVNVGDQIEYTYTVTNSHAVLNALNIVVTETAANFTGVFANLTVPAQATDGIDIDGVGGLNDLAAGESLTFTAVYTLSQTDIDSGMVDNQAAVEAADPFGNDLATDSDNDARSDGVDGDDSSAGGDGSANSTLVPIEIVPSIQLVKSVSEVLDTNGSGLFGDIGDTVLYEFTVANTGNVSLADVTVTDTGLTALTGVSTLTPEPAFDGILEVGEGLVTPVLAATATYVIAEADSIAGEIENIATTSGAAVAVDGNGDPGPAAPLPDVDPVTDTSDTGSDPDLDSETGVVPQITDPATEGTGDDPTIVTLPEVPVTELILTKTTPLETVMLGSSVPYTITVENDSFGIASTNVVDTLPQGFTYTPGSGLIDGVPTEPTISGRVLTWPVDLGPNQTVAIELVARVGAGTPTGYLTNVAEVFDAATGDVLAPPATATVSRLPEAVFDCSDIIGKVFDDGNFNGYQDPAVDDRAAITNQDIFGGKFGGKGEVLPAPPQGEPGLPNVRLVTPTGTVITTDEHGRYSVPCAELPGGIGANFTLKLDPDSLPTGYRITTENPRTMRVTAGIMTEMNFGAALGRVLDIDLTASAFDGNTPVTALDQGVTQLLMQVADTPSVIRISYFTNGEGNRVALQRIAELEDLIDRRWSDIGRYRLIVETQVLRLQ